MNVIITSVGGRAPPARKRGRLAQDLIRPLQLPILAFQLLQSVRFVRGQTGPLAGISFGLPYPAAQCAIASRGLTLAVVLAPHAFMSGLA
jgi:hypothetical protein